MHPLVLLLVVACATTASAQVQPRITTEQQAQLLNRINNERTRDFGAGWRTPPPRAGPVSWDNNLAADAKTHYSQQCTKSFEEPGYSPAITAGMWREGAVTDAQAAEMVPGLLGRLGEWGSSTGFRYYYSNSNGDGTSNFFQGPGQLDPAYTRVGCVVYNCATASNQLRLLFGCKFAARGGQVAPAPPPAPTPTPPPGSLTPGEQKALDKHNTYRRNHGAQPLQWDADLASAAKAYISDCRAAWDYAEGYVKHDRDENLWGRGIGENLHWQNPHGNPDGRFEAAVDSWYNEKPLYKPWASQQENYPSGHFTQVVWKASQKLGCAAVSCPDVPMKKPSSARGADIVACRYSPMGNVRDQYTQNVQP